MRPLLIGSSLMLFQQITGQPSVLYYAAKIFKDAGFASDADATRVSVVLGFFKLVMTGDCLTFTKAIPIKSHFKSLDFAFLCWYAAKIFKDIAFTFDADAIQVCVVLGFFKLVMTDESAEIWMQVSRLFKSSTFSFVAQDGRCRSGSCNNKE